MVRGRDDVGGGLVGVELLRFWVFIFIGFFELVMIYFEFYWYVDEGFFVENFKSFFLRSEILFGVFLFNYYSVDDRWEE